MLVLRRWARTDLAPDIGVVENEAAALGLLGSASTSTSTSTRRLPVPRLVGADATGVHADVPAVLMTRLPGRDVLAPPDLDAFLDRLVETLRAIHEVPVPSGTLNYFRPWSLDTVTAPPSWSRRPEVWERAIEIAQQPVPAHERVLVHRDFWPGNVLWQRGKLTGVVDWTHACRGPGRGRRRALPRQPRAALRPRRRRRLRASLRRRARPRVARHRRHREHGRGRRAAGRMALARRGPPRHHHRADRRASTTRSSPRRLNRIS